MKSLKFAKIIVVLTLFGLAIRLIFVPDRFPTYDEIWSFNLAKAELEKIVKGSIAANNAPLYFLPLHFLLKVSYQLSFLRLISVLFGTVTIPVMGWVGKKLFNAKTGILSCFLAVFSPAFIFESTNLRMYSLGILESLLAIFLFLNFLRKNKLTYLVFLSLTLIFGLYTHHFFGLIILTLNFFVFTNYQKYKKLLPKWIAAQSAVFLFCLPLFWLILTQPTLKIIPTSQTWLKIPAVFVGFTVAWDAIQALKLFPFDPSLPLNVPVLILSAEMFFLFWMGLKSLKKSRNDTIFFAAYIFIPIIIVFPFSALFKPVFGVRSFIIFSPAYYLAAGLGLAGLKKTRLLGTLCCFLISSGLILSGQYSGFKSSIVYADPYGFVKQKSLPGDIFLHSDPYTLLLARYYLGDQGQFAVAGSWFPPETETAIGYRLLPESTFKVETSRFWYFLLESQYYQKNLAEEKQKEFSKEYQTVLTKNFPYQKVRVTLFEKK